jgi:hypothetical protein
MTDKYLRSLVDKLNRNKFSEGIFIKSLSLEVDYARVWDKKIHPGMSIGDISPYIFYFIKTTSGKYIGTVLDMSQDLHWYIMPSYRKRGYLTNALIQVILPHLFINRRSQRITINSRDIGEKNFKASENVALKVGFKGNGMEYVLKPKKNLLNFNVQSKYPGIADDRVEALQKTITYLSCSMLQVSTEIELSLGKSNYSDRLAKLADETKKYTVRIQDACSDFEKKQ